jgi:uncharacterized protein YecT (DUF1311 family)
MKTILTTAVVTLFISVISPSASAQSQIEMNEQAAQELAVQDKALNKYYQILMKGDLLCAKSKKDLREAQRAWNKYVEFHMKNLFPLEEGENPLQLYGSIYPMEFDMEITTLVAQRVIQLKLLAGDISADLPDILGKWIVRESLGIKAVSDGNWFQFNHGGKVVQNTSFGGGSNGTWTLDGNELTITVLADPNDPDDFDMTMTYTIKSNENGRMVFSMGSSMVAVLEKE